MSVFYTLPDASLLLFFFFAWPNTISVETSATLADVVLSQRRPNASPSSIFFPDFGYQRHQDVTRPKLLGFILRENGSRVAKEEKVGSACLLSAPECLNY